jgi:hypothetical protein
VHEEELEAYPTIDANSDEKKPLDVYYLRQGVLHTSSQSAVLSIFIIIIVY